MALWGLTICRAQEPKWLGARLSVLGVVRRAERGLDRGSLHVRGYQDKLEGTRYGGTPLEQAECMDGCPQGMCWRWRWPVTEVKWKIGMWESSDVLWLGMG